MRFKKPEPIPLLFIICATCLLLGLGAWQLQRLNWKQQQLAMIEAAQSEPALGNFPPDVKGLEYRLVHLTGTFLNDKMFHLVGGKQHEGAGFFVVTPFRLEDDGRVVLVNRGFAPEGKEGAPEGLQTIDGVIRPNRIRRLFMPENHPEMNVWFYEDIPAMSALVGEDLPPLIVEQTGEQKRGEYPIPSDGKIILRNDHMHYAITWFSLAVIGVVMFGFYYREKEPA